VEPYDIERMPADLRAWMDARFLTPILNIEGGWENWMQIDFPTWLDAQTGRQLDIRREQPLERPGGRVDWLINGTVGVELKAQTHKTTRGRFLEGVREDVNKLSRWTDRGELETGIALAAAIDEHTRQALANGGFVEWFRYADLVVFMVRLIPT
jgi:hypothetical protein